MKNTFDRAIGTTHFNVECGAWVSEEEVNRFGIVSKRFNQLRARMFRADGYKNWRDYL